MRGVRAVIFGSALMLMAALATAASADGLPVTPQKLVLAQQLVEAAKLLRTTTFAMNVMMRPFIQQINAGQGSPELKAYTVDLIKSELDALQQKMAPIFAETYARTFDERQLADILAFYRSPTGRLLIEKQPELAREGQLAMIPLIPPMQRDLIDKMFEHICQIQTCTPEQHSKLAAVKEQVLQKLASQTQAPVEMPAQ
jgi:hypothetical protein